MCETTATHLGAGRGVPDHDQVVVRSADDAQPVRGERDRKHRTRVARERQHLDAMQDALVQMTDTTGGASVQAQDTTQDVHRPPTSVLQVEALPVVVGRFLSGWDARRQQSG